HTDHSWARGEEPSRPAECLGGRADPECPPPLQSKVLDTAAPGVAQHAIAVRVVYVDECVVALSQRHDLRQWRQVTIHAENAVGDDDPRARILALAQADFH